jgi:cyanoexosortase B
LVKETLPMTSPSPSPSPRIPALKIPALAAGTWAILAGLMLLYGPLFYHWLQGWLFKSISIEHEYYSHGVLGFPLAAYCAWQQRDRWNTLPDRRNGFGAALLGLAAAMYLTGLADVVNLSLVVLLLGMVLWLKGWAGLKLNYFPLILVLLATPTDLPYLVTTHVLPLQQVIASFIGVILNLFGDPVTVNNIYVYFTDGAIIEVAPYCAGLKLLFTNIYVSLMLLYWTGLWKSNSRSLTFMGAVVMLSFLANVLRNTILSFFHGGGNENAFEWLHEGWGGDVFSLVMLGGVFWLLTSIEQHWPLERPSGEGNGLTPAGS